ncbi:hypothetical protein SEA_NICEHOUSE_273 [Rhodococcus phage NiceHouse]|nr:hypothetical protein SEA_NICEHOUSE_273 [Rhodococcus phage NiceHouse]
MTGFTNLNNGYVRCDQCHHTVLAQDAYWHNIMHIAEEDDNVW